MLAVTIFVFTRKLFIRLVWLSLVINRPTLTDNNDIVVFIYIIRTKAAANAAAATQGISIPYGYTGGFVSGLPIDQGLRPAAYPFLMPTGQYVTQMPYPQQVGLVECLYNVYSFLSLACYYIWNSSS